MDLPLSSGNLNGVVGVAASSLDVDTLAEAGLCSIQLTISTDANLAIQGRSSTSEALSSQGKHVAVGQTITTNSLASLVDELVQVLLALVVHHFGSGDDSAVSQVGLSGSSDSLHNFALTVFVALQFDDNAVFNLGNSLVSIVAHRHELVGVLSTGHQVGTNDTILSHLYSIMILAFFLCLSMLLILSATVCTMKSGSLNGAFGWAKYHISVSNISNTDQYMVTGGREAMKEDLAKWEKDLEGKGIPAICHQMLMLTLPVTHGEIEHSPTVYQGTGVSMDLFEYTEGTAPQHANEIAITRITASKLNAGIGDTVTITTLDGGQEYIITAYYQAMQTFGDGILLHVDAEVNYAQGIGSTAVLVLFPDDPGKAEIQRRMDVIRELYPQCEAKTCEQVVSEMLIVTDAMDAMKYLVAVLTVLLTALITVLMERSFIAKEKGEIALMKAIGTRNGKIYGYHTLRFTFVGLVAVIIGEIFAMPLTNLCIDPIFNMMGLDQGVDYLANPVEMYLIFPALILVTTAATAFLTSLYTRKIKSSDTANIE